MWDPIGAGVTGGRASVTFVAVDGAASAVTDGAAGSAGSGAWRTGVIVT